MSEKQNKVRIKLVKSRFGRLKKHAASLSGLGLRKINQEVVIDATPENMGMVNQVRYLIEVEEVK
ncbi:MAG TPA: 50S ribosomal protein L30 [SAR86 cluster bacterium]|jgi:large subunit ribosomal protein L30|nr:50S ribosomal protein L30 [Gammaproteobacteria bacterium]HJM15730.1 50S ribosomal protein L30 [SAR86 cluster bacterium]MBQ09578.1 50S ribosomal protein L30 [Gammaproteobacteria bacterium]MDP6146994.1 50S ribosomal protein L30 [Gammaproteobacteria bacterium]HJL79892.1 50S ribosomal protein L30 [Gammaproteobacteria bacterium]|tara:strand:+ start:2236 stop:2430 length:195 start_codon:yes stop_codon:yes gene_type:complete